MLSISEKNSAEITTTGTMRDIFPKEPGMKSMGAKAATVVSTPKVTGTAISWVPRIAAPIRSGSRCWWL